MILSLTGPSGAGKTTLLHNLLKHLPDAKPLISYTTRAARPTDEPGEYAYVSDDEFERMRLDGSFLWTASPHGKKYATRKTDIDAALEGSLSVPILVISAAEKLSDYARAQGKENAATFLYITVDDEAELRKRFAARGDLSTGEVESRLTECRSWDAEAKKSTAPFIFIDAGGTREETLERALTALSRE